MKRAFYAIFCLLFLMILCSCQTDKNKGNDLSNNASVESFSTEEKQGENTHSDVSAYDYEEIDGGIAITYFKNYDYVEYDKIIIPAEIDNKPVIGIGLPDDSSRVMGAIFGKCEVVIPDTVTYISGRAFEGAKGLVRLSGGKNCKSIGEAAFANCSNLVEVTFLDGVTELAGNAFAGCTAWYENHS